MMRGVKKTGYLFPLESLVAYLYGLEGQLLQKKGSIFREMSERYV